jgi:hypothetical protein
LTFGFLSGIKQTTFGLPGDPKYPFSGSDCG